MGITATFEGRSHCTVLLTTLLEPWSKQTKSRPCHRNTRSITTTVRSTIIIIIIIIMFCEFHIGIEYQLPGYTVSDVYFPFGRRVHYIVITRRGV